MLELEIMSPHGLSGTLMCVAVVPATIHYIARHRPILGSSTDTKRASKTGRSPVTFLAVIVP